MKATNGSKVKGAPDATAQGEKWSLIAWSLGRGATPTKGGHIEFILLNRERSRMVLAGATLTSSQSTSIAIKGSKIEVSTPAITAYASVDDATPRPLRVSGVRQVRQAHQTVADGAGDI